MRVSKVSLPLLIILLTVLGSPAIAFAADVFHFKGETAEASFYTSDATNCIVTSMYLYANNGRSQDPPGRPQPSSYGYVSIYRYDICNGYQTLFSGYGYSIPLQGSFDVRPTLDQAALSTTIQVYDYVSASYHNVSIDVAWIGGESSSQGRSVSRSEGPGYRYMSRSTGTYRSAQAAGTISMGTGNLTNGQPAYYASLNSSKSGTVSISN
ncbi:MAG TPA: hypothetical protein VLQ45_20790 [Thermoanaerobaculia bacterium]|nr:hypothetical protein [Thermoanaerobaculia bacterium]